MAAYGVLVALLARERLGIGQKIDISHLGSMMALEGLAIVLRLFLGKEIPREDRHNVANPLWNHYLCADGKWIVLGMLQPDRQWPFVCKALGIEHLVKEPRFENADRRKDNSEELISILLSIRNDLRQAKQWELADKIRNQLADIGVVLEDTAKGTIWKRSR